MSQVMVRRELPQDRGPIRQVHSRAFDRNQGVPPEAVIWDLLHDAGDVRAELSFVASVNGQVVGHAGCSRAFVEEYEVVALGPVGVLPDHQGHAVGTSLVEAVVAAADAADEQMLVLLGDPRFYGRFGFELAAALGVIPPDPSWAEVFFQLRRLSAWSPSLVGRLRYAPAFSTV